MRGLPDDFNRDTIVKEYNITDNKSWGVDVGGNLKLIGIPLGIGVNVGVMVTLAVPVSVLPEQPSPVTVTE